MRPLIVRTYRGLERNRVDLSRALFLALIPILLLNSSTVAQGSADVTLPLDQAHKAVWELHNLRPGEVFRPSSEHSRGTALAWHHRYLVTNFHVLKNALDRGNLLESVTLSRAGRDVKIKRVVAVNVAYDFALLEAAEELDGYLGFSVEALSITNQLTFVGYLSGSLTKEHADNEYMYEDDFQHGVVTRFRRLKGLSGGGILNSDGLIVGLIHSAEVNILYAVKSALVVEFLSRNSGTSCDEARSMNHCFSEGAKETKRMADAGDAMASFKLGSRINNIRLINPGAGHVNYLIASARSGYAFAEFELAASYAKDKRQRLSFLWYEKASESDHLPSIFQLGLCYYDGWGVEKNRTKGLRLIRDAAHRGFLMAAEFLEDENEP